VVRVSLDPPVVVPSRQVGQPVLLGEDRRHHGGVNVDAGQVHRPAGRGAVELGTG
jgi:hypothetical protein